MNTRVVISSTELPCTFNAPVSAAAGVSVSHLEAGLRLLPAPEQVVLNLLYVEELSVPEIALVLDLSEEDTRLLVSTASALLLRALRVAF